MERYLDTYWRYMLTGINGFSILLLCCIALGIKTIIQAVEKKPVYILYMLLLLFGIIFFLRAFMEGTIDAHGDTLMKISEHLNWEEKQAMSDSMFYFEKIMWYTFWTLPIYGILLILESCLTELLGKITHRVVMYVGLSLLAFINLYPAIYSIYWNIPFLYTVIWADALLICLFLTSWISGNMARRKPYSMVSEPVAQTNTDNCGDEMT